MKQQHHHRLKSLVFRTFNVKTPSTVKLAFTKVSLLTCLVCLLMTLQKSVCHKDYFLNCPYTTLISIGEFALLLPPANFVLVMLMS